MNGGRRGVPHGTGLSRSGIVTGALGALLIASTPPAHGGSARQRQPVLSALVEGYAHAIEVNHLELAMTYVHPASPHRMRLRAELEDELSWCFQRAQTVSFERTPSSEGTVSAAVEQRVVRVFGMKFVYGERRSTFVFRRHLGEWRIWDIRSRER